ncbi:MAG: ketoacyl-ACP synthase III [Rhodopirellula sp.]|nr:ketoacyl-ACP synthase III [Rhodopirellula sp.]
MTPDTPAPNQAGQINVAIRDVACHLPSKAVSNDALAMENAHWDMNQVEQRAGVRQRHIAGDNETALDLGHQATLKLLAANPDLKSQIDVVLFCTQCPDYIMPPNACILHKLLDLPETVLAFDINLGCSGYIYALTIARGLIAAGTAANVLIVNADTYSKYIHKKDRSARVLFGDGAATSWIARNDGADSGIIDLLCGTSGRNFDAFLIPAGGCRHARTAQTAAEMTDISGNVRTQENIHMDGMGILSFVNSRVPRQVSALLARNDLSVSDVDLFIFHQASKMALDSLDRLLKIPPDKTFRNLLMIGNTVSASIPIAIREAADQGRLKKGDTVVLCGFGVGMSLGSVLLKW